MATSEQRLRRAPAEQTKPPPRLLVCLGASPTGPRLVRAAGRLAEAAQAQWFAVYVETPHLTLSLEQQEQVSKTLRLAAQLGGQALKLSGFSIHEAVLDFAREHHITGFVLEAPPPRPWYRFFIRSLPDRLLRHYGTADLHLISGEGEEPRTDTLSWRKRWPAPMEYLWAAIGVGACTGLAFLLFPYLALTNLVMIYLLTVVVIASLLDRGPAIFASVFSVASFAFFFVPNYYSFSIANTEYAITLVVMFIVITLISHLTSRIRHQARLARRQERQTAAIYEMSRNLTSKLSLQDLLPEAVDQISRTFDSQVTILLPNEPGKLGIVAGKEFLDDYGSEMMVARWVFRYGHFAGLGTKTLPKARGFYLPLRTSQGSIGVLRLEPARPGKMLDLKSLRFLEAMGSQVAWTIERENLNELARVAQLQIEAERLRNTLLSSVSHDLRTPLTVIAGSASSLLEGKGSLDFQTEKELVQSIYEEAKRLDRLVYNLLEMSRLQSGQVKFNQEWHVLEEVVGCALAQLETQLEDRQVLLHLPADLPMVRIDALLMERVFLNLLENAIKYTTPETPLEISGRINHQELLVEVADRGPGLPPGDEELVFEKFYQSAPGGTRGVGLGLAICRNIIEAHGGRIWAANRPGGGAVFSFTLPLEAGAPSLDKSPPEMQGESPR